jgi:uncharacterized protein
MAPEAAGDGADALRAALRRGLVRAMRARDTDAVAALRTAVAALDNAQAVPVTEPDPARGGAHVAAARTGLGAAEVPRRSLGPAAADAVLRALVGEQADAAAALEALGRAEAAGRLRGQASLLSGYLRPGDAAPPSGQGH